MSQRNLGLVTVFFGVALSVGLIVAHGLAQDDFLVDNTTVALVVVALVILLLPQLPTLARYLTRLRLPGVEAEFREVADRVAQTLDALRASRPEAAEGPATPGAQADFRLDRGLSDTDPNVRIAGITIELERGLKEYARGKGIDAERLSLTRMAELLQEREVLTSEQAQVLQDIANLRNQAVHGANVTTSDALTFESLVDRFLKLLT